MRFKQLIMLIFSIIVFTLCTFYSGSGSKELVFSMNTFYNSHNPEKINSGYFGVSEDSLMELRLRFDDIYGNKVSFKLISPEGKEIYFKSGDHVRDIRRIKMEKGSWRFIADGSKALDGSLWVNFKRVGNIKK